MPAVSWRFEPGARYVLPTGEPVAVNRRLHWVLLIPSFLAALAALFVAGYLTGQMADHSGPLDDIIWILALFMVARLVWRVLEWNHDRFIVTSRRVMLVTGLLGRRVAMMPLIRVTDMTYQQSLLGRMFGWGTFILESAGQDQALRTIDWLPSPDQLYQTVCRLMFDSGAFEGETPPLRTPPDLVPPSPDSEVGPELDGSQREVL